jgi:hypothetical protein
VTIAFLKSDRPDGPTADECKGDKAMAPAAAKQAVV